MATIDLNADVGEECGDDAALLAIVTSANVAAGGHAGGGAVLDATVRQAATIGVAVGAHPSYPDRDGFGRSSMADRIAVDALVAVVEEQVAQVVQACERHGIALSHVKAHGALYNDAAARAGIADAFLRACVSAGAPAVVGLPGTVVEQACQDHGVAFVAEAYADRAYRSDGTLVPRSEPGAVLHDPDAIARRIVALVVEGTIVAVDGTALRLDAQTVCVHGDTPGAVGIAARVRQQLQDAGVEIRRVGAR